MKVRLQSVLILLLALLVAGASAQAARCDLTCGFAAAHSACHEPALKAQHTTVHQNGMSHCASCSGVQRGDAVASCRHSACEHSPVVAYSNTVAATPVAPARLWVSVAFRLALELPGRPAAGRAPPPLLASLHPLSTRLRL